MTVTAPPISHDSVRERESARDEAARFISIIVPIRNEEPFIAATLRGLLSQEYPADRFEILVVDGQSTDRTWEIVSEFARLDPRVRLFQNPKRLSSAARNIGVRQSRGELIAVIDGHCEIEERRFLRLLEGAFERSGADCLGRPAIFEVAGASSLQLAIAAARASRLGHHPDSYIYSNEERFVPAHSLGAMYRRSVFDQIGLFDESFDACEDVEFNHRLDRAGLRCLLAPQITLRYHPRSSLAGLFRQLARYGQGRVRLLRKHPDTLSLKSLLPGVFVAGLAIGAIASIFSSTIAAAYLVVVGLYLAIVLGFSLTIALQRRSAGLLLWLPIVYIAIHLGAGWGIVHELVWGSPWFRHKQPGSCGHTKGGPGRRKGR